MNIYHLPGTGIYGGIKVAYQFAELLCRLGASCVVATPDGAAPQWFAASVPTVSHAEARKMVTERTNILFSHPPDFDELAEWGGRLVNHCQGTDDRMEPIVRDRRVTLLTCWPQAKAYVREVAGRDTIDVGISLSDCFYYDGTHKFAGRVAYMPRRGAHIAQAAEADNASLRFVPIDGLFEQEAAVEMKSSEYYLATSLGEQFGLPAMEAMAAGAVVVSVPVRGGLDYLRHEENCVITEPEEVGAVLDGLSRPESSEKKAMLRHAALRTAMTLRLARQEAHLRRLVANELAFLRH